MNENVRDLFVTTCVGAAYIILAIIAFGVMFYITSLVPLHILNLIAKVTVGGLLFLLVSYIMGLIIRDKAEN